MKRFLVIGLVIIALLAVLAAPATAAPPDCEGSTVVPGHCDRYDEDNNGIPDAGVTVTGHYTQSAYGCEYVVNYRGSFENDPYLDNGWIINAINCGGEHYTYVIVHQSDPRYTGNPDWSIWGTWEYHVLTASGTGNLVRPEHAGG